MKVSRQQIFTLLLVIAGSVIGMTNATPLYKQESSFYGCLTDGTTSSMDANRSPFCDRG